MLVLASNSPRRKELLMAIAPQGVGSTPPPAGFNWEFVVRPVPVDESGLPGETPQAYVLRLAEMKARAAWEKYAEQSDPGTLFLGADTTVASDGEILGKPASAEQARDMLLQLRGRVHQVFTAMALVHHPDGRCVKDVCVSQVAMRLYTDEEIAVYVASGDPLDKAGAYAIQHPVFRPAAAVQGCYANVVGLPLCRLGLLMQAYNDGILEPVWQACQEATGMPCLVYQNILAEEITPPE
jgi:nucleoside triphosphate pyrophosphatase